MAEKFSGTLLPQNQNVEETQKTALDLLSKINKVSQSAEDALNAVKKTIPGTYTPPAWQPYPAGTYSFPSGNQIASLGDLKIGAATTAPTFGSGTILKAWWRDWGNGIDIFYKIYQTSTSGANSGSGLYLLPLPLGKSLNTTFVTTSTTQNNATHVGKLSMIAFGTDTYYVDAQLSAYGASYFSLHGPYANSNGAAQQVIWSSSGIGNTANYSIINISGIVCGIPIQ